MVIEDLYIIDDENLLFSVSAAGSGNYHMDSVYKSKYKIGASNVSPAESGSKIVEFIDPERVIHEGGAYVRIGNINRHGDIVYSKRGVGIIGSTVKISSTKAHQPFQYEDKTYYTQCRDSAYADSIFCNNEEVFHLNDVNKYCGWKYGKSPYVEGGKPYVLGNIILFEANRFKCSHTTWETLAYDLETKQFKHLRDGAANPAYYKGNMFFCDMPNMPHARAHRVKAYDLTIVKDSEKKPI